MLSLLGPDADWDEGGLLVSMTVYPLVKTWFEHLGPGGLSLMSVILKVVQVSGHTTGAMVHKVKFALVLIGLVMMLQMLLLLLAIVTGLPKLLTRVAWFVEARRFWFPILAELHEYMIALSRITDRGLLSLLPLSGAKADLLARNSACCNCLVFWMFGFQHGSECGSHCNLARWPSSTYLPRASCGFGQTWASCLQSGRDLHFSVNILRFLVNVLAGQFGFPRLLGCKD